MINQELEGLSQNITGLYWSRKPAMVKKIVQLLYDNNNVLRG